MPLTFLISPIAHARETFVARAFGSTGPSAARGARQKPRRPVGLADLSVRSRQPQNLSREEQGDRSSFAFRTPPTPAKRATSSGVLQRYPCQCPHRPERAEHWRKTSFSKRIPATGGQARWITNQRLPSPPKTSSALIEPANPSRGERNPWGRSRYPGQAMNPSGTTKPYRTSRHIGQPILQDPSSLHNVTNNRQSPKGQATSTLQTSFFLLG
jgi:hypothetical protein